MTQVVSDETVLPYYPEDQRYGEHMTRADYRDFVDDDYPAGAALAWMESDAPRVLGRVEKVIKMRLRLFAKVGVRVLVRVAGPSRPSIVLLVSGSRS